MPWDKTTPTDPKYRTPQHRHERTRLTQQMKAQGYLTCTQPTCLMPTRTITPTDAWHLGHDDTGNTYIGPTHARCNVVDGAKRGNSRSRGGPDPTRWRL